MSEETGQVTGTKDNHYNLLWFTERCLRNALRLQTYLADAERDGLPRSSRQAEGQQPLTVFGALLAVRLRPAKQLGRLLVAAGSAATRSVNDDAFFKNTSEYLAFGGKNTTITERTDVWP